MRSRGSGYYGVALLDALAREAARVPTPPVDWDRIERTLLATLETAEREAPLPIQPVARSTKVGSPWAIALVAAAAVAVIQLAPHADVRMHAPVASRVVSVPGMPGTGSLSGPLKRGDVAEAGADPIQYEARGAVTFTIAPASRVKVLSEETPSSAPQPAMTVALLQGSIHAEVVPHTNGEVFAVEVEQTRVAAHGTSFTVSREGDRVVVEIAHGSVAIGPAGHPGSTHRWLLVGPDKASFSLDGATDATWLSEPLPATDVAASDDNANVAAEPESSGAASSRSDESAEPVGSALPRPNRRSPADAAPRARAHSSSKMASDGADHNAAIAGILSRLGVCYERQVASFGVRFSIRSSLTLTVLPSGTVREGLFEPPLSPTLMTCARDAIAAARFPQDAATAVVRVPVVLSPSP
jgi:hypothetical protein